MREDKVLATYIFAVSRLTGCLQHMQTVEIPEEEEDSDQEDIEGTPFKAAEQEVVRSIRVAETIF